MKTPNEKSAGPRVIWVLLPPTNNSTNIVKKNPKKITEMRMSLTGLDFPKKLASMLSFYIFVVNINKTMLAFNIFKWIGEFFTEVLFQPFNMIRQIAQENMGWWKANLVNWIFLLILLVLLWYWMKESQKFIKEGTEDRAN